MRKKRAVGVAIVVTALATWVGVNLLSGTNMLAYRYDVDYGVRDPQFQRALGNLLGPPILGGNRVTGLENGDEIFPAMLEAIRGAQHSVTFETYIYWSGEIGQQFADALSERARAGVPVHVLLDWAGSGKMDQSQLESMREAGVAIEKYHPIAWYTLDRVNNRTHRKILVVDGKLAFTGGVGIADLWMGDADSPEHWRDSHFRLEGPAAAQMQSAFMDNWLELHRDVLHDERYFPALEPEGGALAQVFSSSPDGGGQSMRHMYLMAISAARETIHLASSYFVPDDLSVQILAAAARRGVAIQILLPGPIMDVKIVQRASRSRWGDLLEAGISIHEYQPTMLHSKVMIVDTYFVTVGSTNFDDRSFRLNDETSMNVLDEELARKQVAVFAEDLRAAKQVTLEEWQNRPWREKLVERAAGLLRRQL